MRPTVLLFDIDGTLVTTGGAGRRAIQRAFEELHGRPDALSFHLDGMTDRAIARSGLEAIGALANEAAVETLLARYLVHLGPSVASTPDAEYQLHPGMSRAVEAALEAGCAVGLGTGNIREGARIKLERVGIYDRFLFGGFGSDHENRVELLRIGAQRGAARLGVSLAECRVVVIGDTPKDVHAALGIGAECVGVGTGRFRPNALLAEGATAAFETLEDDGALDALLAPRARAIS